MASRRVREIESVLNGIEDDLNKLSKAVSNYDKEINNLYHKLEVSKFNACEGYYFSKQLQGLLQKRRLVKTEMKRLRILSKSLGKSITDRIENVQKQLHKHLHEDNGVMAYQVNFDMSFNDIESEVFH
ncbi:hypothetical protein [Cytobacillus gottheilii]|uniref:hypothetical protein n=1 Tax=Cytobacillus gottheilii TaxID=859144 RepID=UPI0009BC63CC|nr:hypothetical protein [Cytobacillus gottheilii]